MYIRTHIHVCIVVNFIFLFTLETLINNTSLRLPLHYVRSKARHLAFACARACAYAYARAYRHSVVAPRGLATRAVLPASYE